MSSPRRTQIFRWHGRERRPLGRASRWQQSL